MDRRIIALLGFAAALAVVVVIVLVTGGDDGGEISTDLETKPTIEASTEPPPTELVTDDIVTGDGAEAKEGDDVTVQYVGVLYDTGSEFDTSWGQPDPFEFKLGAGSVIPGWDEGIVGMREGGRRELIIPPDLAYGPQGQPPDIPPDSTLVFVVDLLKVN